MPQQMLHARKYLALTCRHHRIACLLRRPADKARCGVGPTKQRSLTDFGRASVSFFQVVSLESREKKRHVACCGSVNIDRQTDRQTKTPSSRPLVVRQIRTEKSTMAHVLFLARTLAAHLFTSFYFLFVSRSTRSFLLAAIRLLINDSIAIHCLQPNQLEFSCHPISSPLQPK